MAVCSCSLSLSHMYTHKLFFPSAPTAQLLAKSVMRVVRVNAASSTALPTRASMASERNAKKASSAVPTNARTSLTLPTLIHVGLISSLACSWLISFKLLNLRLQRFLLLLLLLCTHSLQKAFILFIMVLLPSFPLLNLLTNPPTQMVLPPNINIFLRTLPLLCCPVFLPLPTLYPLSPYAVSSSSSSSSSSCFSSSSSSSSWSTTPYCPSRR